MFGIIIEFKNVGPAEEEDLEQAAELAVQQIEAKGYWRELLERGVRRIIKLAIFFRGEEVLVRHGRNEYNHAG